MKLILLLLFLLCLPFLILTFLFGPKWIFWLIVILLILKLLRK